MGRRILFVSQFADPNLVGGNNNVFRQAKALKNGHGVDVEILTWPEADGWSGPLPFADPLSGKVPHVTWRYDNVNFHVVKLPRKFMERVLKDSDWNEAVEIGCALLREIKPAIVHLQHWRGLWWLLESANQLAIPTVYSPHDWGLGCLRTILVKGEGGLCNGVVEIDKCSKCVFKGRNLLGRANELLVSNALGERLVAKLDQLGAEQWLSGRGAVRMDLRSRVTSNYTRAKRVVMNLHAIVVPNEFAKRFFLQFGISDNRIHVQPWYCDSTVPAGIGRVDQNMVALGYIGRISSEKGVKRIFEALLSDSIANPFHLVIAGVIDGSYAKELHSKYRHNVGKHTVEWMGWIPQQDVHRFYKKVDAVIISSECIENGPLALIESFAFKRPVIISDTPTARELVQEGLTGYFTKISSTESLTQVISKLSLNPGNLFAMSRNIPTVHSSFTYANAIKEIYDSLDVSQSAAH